MSSLPSKTCWTNYTFQPLALHLATAFANDILLASLAESSIAFWTLLSMYQHLRLDEALQNLQSCFQTF